jgi:hypothetical protein
MAVKVSAWVWDNIRELKGTELLFMLALADKSGDEDGACWPSMNRLAEMCRVKSLRALQKISAKLQKLGYIGVVLNKGTKTKSGNTNKFYINGYRKSIGLFPIFTGEHPQSSESSDRKRFVHNPEGIRQKNEVSNETPEIKEVSTETPDEVSYGTGDEVSTETPKPLLEPSVEQIHAVAKAPGKPLEKEKEAWEYLADAMAKTVVGKDVAFYRKQAKLLIQAGIPTTEFGQYVKWVQRLSRNTGNWKVSVGSLTSNGRMSEYVTDRDAHLAKLAKEQAAPMTHLSRQAQDTEDLQAYLLGILTQKGA